MIIMYLPSICYCHFSPNAERLHVHVVYCLAAWISTYLSIHPIPWRLTPDTRVCATEVRPVLIDFLRDVTMTTISTSLFVSQKYPHNLFRAVHESQAPHTHEFARLTGCPLFHMHFNQR